LRKLTFFAALAGITAIEALGGPQIPWKAGRTDYENAEAASSHRGNVGDRWDKPNY
jgi:peroxiredoxin